MKNKQEGTVLFNKDCCKILKIIELYKKGKIKKNTAVKIISLHLEWGGGMSYKSFELFSGCGGLALGIEKAGFNVIGLVEKDKDATETLIKNRNNWKVYNVDINDILNDIEIMTNLRKERIDLLAGGFPCQSFSYAGKKRGLEDTRGTLFYSFVKFIEKTKPKSFLIENVKGLVSHEKGRTLGEILDILNNLSYTIYYKILNAWSFGVPQKRERIFIVGFSKDLSINKKFSFPREKDYKPVLKDVLRDVPFSEGQKYSDQKKKVLDLVPEGGCWINLPEKVAKEYLGKSYYSGGGKRGYAKRLSWNEPCLTLTTSPQQKQTERCHPDETRPLTVREYARIQTFPDDWFFSGSLSSQYKQIGNAVPVSLAFEISLSIKKHLDLL